MKYLETARPDSSTAIFGLVDHLVLLQGFTGNPQMLRKALEAASNSKASALRDDTMGEGVGVEDLSTLANAQNRGRHR